MNDHTAQQTSFDLLLESVCLSLVLRDQTKFVKAAQALKQWFPLSADQTCAYNLMNAYPRELKTVLESLRDPEVLAWFAEELVLPPAVALELSRSTQNMDEQILQAVRLDGVMHDIEQLVPLKSGDIMPFYDVTNTFRFLRFLVVKDPSCQLFAHAFSQLLNNPEIIVCNIQPEDLVILETHHAVTQAMQDNPSEHSPLSVIKQHDFQIKQILDKRQTLLDQARTVAKIPQDLYRGEPKEISIEPIMSLLQHGMTETATAMIESSRLKLASYQQAKDLLDAMPGLSEITVQVTFNHLLNQNPTDPVKADLRYYFYLAQERNFSLKMGPEKYKVGYFLDGFEEYLADRGNHPIAVKWAIPFFDQALAPLSDQMVKEYRIKDFAPPVVANACNRLKRLSLEHDLGI